MKKTTLDEVAKTLDEIGTTFCNLAQRADGGTLLFFPSMKMMNNYLERWKTTSLWNRANWFCEGEEEFKVLVAKYE
jgi:Rad3-related DNA helicase